jgi:hypothetical protein
MKAEHFNEVIHDPLGDFIFSTCIDEYKHKGIKLFRIYIGNDDSGQFMYLDIEQSNRLRDLLDYYIKDDE